MNHPPIENSSRQRVLREHLSSVYASRRAGVYGHLCFTLIGGAMGYFYLHLPLALPFVLMLACVNLYVLASPRWHDDMPEADAPVGRVDTRTRWSLLVLRPRLFPGSSSPPKTPK
ncbi:hypothetical protein [Variovorax sp. RCC_210]|uniref:hypothetical protein n=1 Tax=Variovorax sp. RCC_210 TaxID=3239217 RepID=UPI00352661D7